MKLRDVKVIKISPDPVGFLQLANLLIKCFLKNTVYKNNLHTVEEQRE
jgi:hypothetical protein